MARVSRPFIVIVMIALLAATALPVARPARAQQGSQGQGHAGHVHGGQTSAAGASAAKPMDHAMDKAMDHAMAGKGHHSGHEMAHLLMSPHRAVTPDDSARAAGVVAALRKATAKYQDVTKAEADGFEMFAPQLKEQRVYHFTRNRNAIKAAFRFDPEQPTSLLYAKQPDGAMKLVGAMYTAPKRASMEELDRRVPLSMAQWHRHVNICVPKRGATERWVEKDSTGTMKFGPAGSIATEAACDAADGRWLESLFGWMVHVNAWSEPLFEH